MKPYEDDEHFVCQFRGSGQTDTSFISTSQSQTSQSETNVLQPKFKQQRESDSRTNVLPDSALPFRGVNTFPGVILKSL